MERVCICVTISKMEDPIVHINGKKFFIEETFWCLRDAETLVGYPFVSKVYLLGFLEAIGLAQKDKEMVLIPNH